ncbi:MAG: penicillin-binding protein 1B [Moraxellaceae bacterium]|nr:penicillin-binding protein 1B [Moraxellaceae bacterium]
MLISPALTRLANAPRERGFILTILLILLVLVLVGVMALGFWVMRLDGVVKAKFEGKRWAIPARVYARPLELYAGAPLSPHALQEELGLLGYRQQAVSSPGSWQQKGNEMYVHSRGFVFSDGVEKSQVLRLRFDGKLLADVASTLPNERGLVRLEPMAIGAIYPRHQEDRVLMQLKEAPPHLIDALLATEDRAFYRHYGISVRGILRAMWVNMTAGGLRQGGSTLTQQLVKNFYLTDERTLSRKLNEVAMALLLERRYSKDDILETYLNEVNLGQSGQQSVNGFGLGAQFYFGQPVSELQLHQSALLVGMVQGPSLYNPRRNPERAKARRDLVLDNLFVENKISAAERDAAKAKPLDVMAKPTAATAVYPAFLDMVRRQLRSEYKEEDLGSEGLRIFTTLDPRVQNAADAAFTGTLTRHAKTYGKKMEGLQGAMLVSHPENGELLALVGGAGTFTGYNRALDADRQVGSLIKPAVYLTALDSGLYTLVSPLDDSPVQLLSQGGKTWEPKNYDMQDHGVVPLYSALAHSYNQATIRLGMTVGVPSVISTLQRLGVKQPLANYPSLMLGAVNMKPVDVLALYQTFAAGGFRAPPRSIREVLDSQGKPLRRYGLEVQQFFDAAPIYLLNHALQATMREGTGASAAVRLPGLLMAGKTGTTNDLRDAWFAGYAGNYLAVVWLGHDDNRPTGLSGGSGALPVWTDFMTRLQPVSAPMPAPENVQWQWADRATGLLSAEHCPDAVYFPFRTDTLPQEAVPCVGGEPAVFDRMLNRVMSWF